MAAASRSCHWCWRAALPHTGSNASAERLLAAAPSSKRHLHVTEHHTVCQSNKQSNELQACKHICMRTEVHKHHVKVSQVTGHWTCVLLIEEEEELHKSTVDRSRLKTISHCII